MERVDNLWHLRSDPHASNPDAPSQDYAQLYRRQPEVPIVIDNGSHQFRIGWAGESQPRYSFRNVLWRNKPVKNEDFRIAVGNMIPEVEVSKSHLCRNAFEKDVVYHMDTQEHIMDYGMSLLAIDSHPVPHPVVMTECLGNPNYARGQVSELLFEAYGVPSIAFGIDGVFAYMYHTHVLKKHSPKGHALIVASGHSSTVVVPVVHGEADVSKARKIHVAGAQATDWLTRMLGARNPGLRTSVTTPRAEVMKEHLGYTYPGSYWHHCADMENWAHESNKTAAAGDSITPVVNDRKSVKWDHFSETVQLPYVPSVEVLDPATAAQRTADMIAKREAARAKAAERFREMARKKKEAKIAELSAKLEDPSLDEVEADAIRKELEERKLHLESGHTKPQHAEGSEGWLKQNDPQAWLQRAVQERDEILARQQRRARVRAEFSKRHSEANRKRLMLIAGAAGTVEEAETEGNSKNKKQKLKRPAEAKKKAPPAKKKKDKDRDEDDDEDVNMGEEIIEDDDEDDNFGANDEDWLVYREMSRDLSSDEEEEDAQRLKQLQRDIEALDESQRKPQISEAEWNQIRLTTERGAVGEVCFSPVSILGVDCAGLVETITRYVLPHYPSEVQYEMLSHVYVYGGNTKLDGFCDRLQMDLQSYMPYDKVQVRTFPAEDPLNDSWRGASALWTHNGQYHQASQPVVRRWEEQTGWITRAMYDEMGHGYLNEHAASNVFVPTPVAPTM